MLKGKIMIINNVARPLLLGLLAINIASFDIVVASKCPYHEEDSSYVIASEANNVYKMVYDHYSDILELYYKLENAPICEKDYYTTKVVQSIAWHVQQDKLPVYGNILNKFWRNLGSTSGKIAPLKKFEETLSIDAIGHLNKYYKKVIDSGLSAEKMKDLIKCLNNLQLIVKSSTERTCEELRIKVNELESEVLKLRQELASLAKVTKAIGN